MSVNQIEATHFHAVRAVLGEGPVWDERRAVLWFVDIAAPAIHRLAPETGERTSWAAPAKVGWVVPSGGDELIAGLAHGLYRFDPADGSFSLLHKVEADRKGTRINDGGRDAHGNIWFGTMSGLAPEPGGHFYRFDGHSVVETGIPPMRITNGPCVSPDGRTLYVVDTLGRQILACPIDEHMMVGAPRLFVAIDPAHGYPDGVTCDREGGLWVGLWNGWAARRYDASGILTDEVRFPVANVTKIALGGPDGRTAYATTAREGQEGDTSGHQPLGGDLFRFPVRVPGVRSTESNRPGVNEQ